MALGIAREQIEEAEASSRDRLVGREQTHVGVGQRGRGVVVAGAEVDIPSQPLPLLANHHRHLAVSLESRKPNTTCTPARSICRAQLTLFASSNRALSSTSAVHVLPWIRRRHQAPARFGESPLVR